MKNERKNNRLIKLFLCVLIVITIFYIYNRFVNVKVDNISTNEILKFPLNSEILLDDTTLSNISIKDKSGHTLPIYIYLSHDKKTLIINPPIDGYSLNEKYTLNISSKIHLKSEKLNSKITKKLVVSSSLHASPKKVFRKAEPGDIIGVSGEFMGYKYDHYGIYIGNDRVIHYYSTTGKADDTEIKESDVRTYFRGENYFVLELSNTSLLPKEDVIRRAKERLGEKEYDLLQNNCEHFVIWCKTNESKSYQVDDLSSDEISKLKQLMSMGLNLQ